MTKQLKTKLMDFLKQTPSPKVMLIVNVGILLALLVYVAILLLSNR